MYILTEQLHADGDPKLPWRRYREYLQQHRDRFPASAFALASGALIDVSLPGNPHDAWLEWARFDEPATGKRREERSLDLRVRLLAANHDAYIELYYPQVVACGLSNPIADDEHCDWRYNEVRLNERGQVVHEIEWAGAPGVSARWLIEAADIHMQVLPLDTWPGAGQAGAGCAAASPAGIIRASLGGEFAGTGADSGVLPATATKLPDGECLENRLPRPKLGLVTARYSAAHRHPAYRTRGPTGPLLFSQSASALRGEEGLFS